MIEVGHEKADLIILIQKLEQAIDEHVDSLTIAEIVGSLECVKQGFLLNNLIGHDEQESR